MRLHAVSNAAAAGAARFPGRPFRTAPYSFKAVRAGSGSENMGEFESACRGRGFAAALLASPPMKHGKAGRMQAIWRNGFSNFRNMAEKATG